VCFQFVTKGGAVVDTEPESFPDIMAATKRAEEFMNLPPQKTISFLTFEGDGAVLRAGEIEHTAVMTAEKMTRIYQEAVQAAAEQAGHPVG
jgi:hypothetical protein